MLVGSSDVPIGGELLKIHYPKQTVIRGVRHTVYLFFNDVSKIPVVNKIITVYKSIYNLFCSGIHNKNCSIFKSKLY